MCRETPSQWSPGLRRLRQSSTSARPWRPTKLNQFALTMIGEARLDNIRQLGEQTCADSVPGDFVPGGDV